VISDKIKVNVTTEEGKIHLFLSENETKKQKMQNLIFETCFKILKASEYF
jgi:hypothetical protein